MKNVLLSVVIPVALLLSVIFTGSAQAQFILPGDALVINEGTRALFRVNPNNGSRTVLSDFGNASQGTTGVALVGLAIESSGNILVIDEDAGTSFKGALFRVNPNNGSRTVLSDFGNPSQGTIGNNPRGVAIENSGSILVIDEGTRVLFRVNPTDGSRTVLSDFSDASQGATGLSPFGLAIERSGNILVIDPDAGTGGGGALFRVNPTDGSRTVLSDFGDASQGDTGITPVGVAVEGSRNILVIDASAGTNNQGKLFRVNPTDGSRTVLSDFGDASQGITGVRPFGVAVESSGNILVTDTTAGTNNRGALFRVDPTDGSRTVLSDFGNPSQGTTGGVPVGVAVVAPLPPLKPGDILVIDNSAGTGSKGALFRVNPNNGNRRMLSDFGNSNQGPTGVDPVGVIMGVSGDVLVIDSNRGVSGPNGTLFKVNPTTGVRTVISDFSKGSKGPLGANPRGMTRLNNSNVLVIDPDAGTGSNGAMFKVNLSTGNRTMISDFGKASQGDTGADPFGLIRDISGNILVIDESAGTSGNGALFRVDPNTGERTIISDFGGSTPLGADPSGVVVDANRKAVVVDFGAGTGGNGALFRVNRTTGARAMISDFGSAAQGPKGVNPTGLDLETNGNILVIDKDAAASQDGELFRVDPNTGARTVLSNFSNPAKGPTGVNPIGIAVFVPLCDTFAPTILDTNGNNNITGTSLPDVIHGQGGNDTIRGLGGNDIICGGGGNDTLNGGSGDDRLFGGSGNDTLDGGDGTDICDGGTGNNDTAAASCETTPNVP